VYAEEEDTGEQVHRRIGIPENRRTVYTEKRYKEKQVLTEKGT
jgi:hypothetical protein